MKNIERIKDSARGRWCDILIDVGGIPREYLDGAHHPCPRCGGDDRFRLIDAGAGAVLCNQCFREKNGDGISAIQWMTGRPFPDAMALVAEYLGLRVDAKRAKKKVGAEIEILPWSLEIVALWTVIHKPGISADAVARVGGQIAKWRAPSGDVRQVIAIPIRAARGAEPGGWVLYDSSGHQLPVRGGAKKMRCTAGAEPGWLGDLARLDEAKIVWKVEGVSDMLALESVIPEDLRPSHIALTNAFGAGEKPHSELVEQLAGKIIVVVRDRDRVGQEGGQRWADAIAAGASEVRIVDPPEREGVKDLRDWLQDGGTFNEIRATARAAPVVIATSDGGIVDQKEDVDGIETNPERLAVEFLSRAGILVRYWREDAHIYDGQRWCVDPAEEMTDRIVRFLIVEFSRLYEIAKADGEEKPKKPRITRSVVANVEMVIRALRAVPSSIEYGSELVIDEDGRVVSAVNPRRTLIAFRNGILDVDRVVSGESAELEPHRPEYFSPVVLPYEYDPSVAPGGMWRWFLATSLQSHADKITILQEWMGYCLTPDTSHQCCLLLEGEGRNGKSVYQAALQAVVGVENCSYVDLESFGQRFALGSTIGKLVNVIDDIQTGDRVAEGIFKSWISGQTVQVDRKNRSAIACIPTARVSGNTNDRPRFHDRSEGIWRRIMLIKLDHRVPDDERIAGMDKPTWWSDGPEKADMPGLFNWALEGLLRLKKQGGFTDVECVRTERDEYRAENNPAQEFLADYVELGADEDSIESGMLYREYSEWSQKNGYKALGARMLGREVARVFGRGRRRRGGPKASRRYHYAGLRLTARDISWGLADDASG